MWTFSKISPYQITYVCFPLAFQSHAHPVEIFLDLSILTKGDLHKSASFSLCIVLNWSLLPPKYFLGSHVHTHVKVLNKYYDRLLTFFREQIMAQSKQKRKNYEPAVI